MQGNPYNIGLGTSKLSQRRVAERVKAGGHNVPTKDIKCRFERSLKNLPLALMLADRSIILDNSAHRTRLILSMEYDRTKYVAAKAPRWVKEHVLEVILAHKSKRSKEL